jgi:pimeloyl-ACP methyl ester carboxylesterase
MKPSLSWAIVAIISLAACSGPSAAAPSAPSSTPLATPTATVTAAEAGRPIDVGGRSLFLACQGSEGPTVILEAGLTGDHRTWERVMPAISDDIRVCAYDRANIAPSDPAPKPRTAGDMVDDLHALLDAASIAPPYVLVGFSFGGLVTQLYAANHPDEVAGVVLIESNHPEEAEQFEEQLTATQIEEEREYVQSNPEGVDFYGSLDEVQAAGSLPDVPLVVVTATVSEGWPPDWDSELFDRLRSEQQKDLASRVPGGRQILAEGSSHHVPSQRPDIVIEAIESVLGEAD